MTSHTLILLRHGKSDWSTPDPDVRRPLAGRGRRQAAEAGQWLAEHVDRLDLAIVSPAERARTTWQLASAELPQAAPVRIEDDAYAASGRTLLELVRGLADDLGTVLLVGHNPGLEDLLETLTGRWVLMKTSGLAVVELPGTWSSAGGGTATLRTSGRPPAASATLLGS